MFRMTRLAKFGQASATMSKKLLLEKHVSDVDVEAVACMRLVSDSAVKKLKLEFTSMLVVRPTVVDVPLKVLLRSENLSKYLSHVLMLRASGRY